MKIVTIDEFKELMRECPSGGIVFEPEYTDDSVIMGSHSVYPAITTRYSAVSVLPDEDGEEFEWEFCLGDYQDDTKFFIYETMDIVHIMERLSDAAVLNRNQKLSLVIPAE